MSTIAKKSLRVGKYVDTNHVDTLIKTYREERWAQNSERIGQEDSASVWFSTDELEEFIQTAKKSGANGIRMHFGVYPSNYQKQEVAGLQTVVMVANKQTETLAGTIEKDIFIDTNNGLEILAYNMGSLGPSPFGRGIADDDEWGGIGTLVDQAANK
jgi:hypothetical protein